MHNGISRAGVYATKSGGVWMSSSERYTLRARLRRDTAHAFMCFRRISSFSLSIATIGTTMYKGGASHSASSVCAVVPLAFCYPSMRLPHSYRG